MATTGPINTTALVLQVRTSTGPDVYTTVAHSQDASLSLSHDVRDITTKDSAGWAEFLEGLRGAEMSISGLYAYDDTQGADYLADVLIDRTTVRVRFTTAVTGDKYYLATGYITSCELSSPGAEDTATYSASVKITGAITFGTIS